jgi:glycosyltransferase involved in cell wall biosynthesis
MDIVLGSGEAMGDWVSERDGGIYDAMNKGWQRARGDVVYFLNSDDALHDSAVLAKVADAFSIDPELDLLIGQVVYRYDDGHVQLRSFNGLDANSLVYEDLCHQAVFSRRRLFERIGGFNPLFRINADYDWLIRVFKSGARIKWLDHPVALFSAGGSHVSDFSKLVAERKAVRLQFVAPWQLSLALMRRRVSRRLARFLGQVASSPSTQLTRSR